MRKTTRKNCRHPDPSIPVPTEPPREPNTIIDTPRRTRLLCDAQSTAGKLPRKKLFESLGIPKSTGYRILKSQSTRRGNGVHNRGRKPVLEPHQCEAIEAVEDASFRAASASHYAVASSIGLAQGSERSIQRNMAQFSVGTYRAQQKKYIRPRNIKIREIWGFERRYWKLKKFKQYRSHNEQEEILGTRGDPIMMLINHEDPMLEGYGSCFSYSLLRRPRHQGWQYLKHRHSQANQKSHLLATSGFCGAHSRSKALPTFLNFSSYNLSLPRLVLD